MNKYQEILQKIKQTRIEDLSDEDYNILINYLENLIIENKKDSFCISDNYYIFYVKTKSELFELLVKYLKIDLNKVTTELNNICYGTVMQALNECGIKNINELSCIELKKLKNTIDLDILKISKCFYNHEF